MSAFLDIADQIKTQLESVIFTLELDVVVDRQKDIASELKARLGKVKGGVAVVEVGDAKNPDPEGELSFDQNYIVTLVTNPILRKGNTPADELLERICKALHSWKYEADLAHYYEMQVNSFALVKHPQLLIYQVKLSTRFSI